MQDIFDTVFSHLWEQGMPSKGWLIFTHDPETHTYKYEVVEKLPKDLSNVTFSSVGMYRKGNLCCSIGIFIEKYSPDIENERVQALLEERPEIFSRSFNEREIDLLIALQLAHDNLIDVGCFREALVEKANEIAEDFGLEGVI